MPSSDDSPDDAASEPPRDERGDPPPAVSGDGAQSAASDESAAGSAAESDADTGTWHGRRRSGGDGPDPRGSVPPKATLFCPECRQRHHVGEGPTAPDGIPICRGCGTRIQGSQSELDDALVGDD